MTTKTSPGIAKCPLRSKAALRLRISGLDDLPKLTELVSVRAEIQLSQFGSRTQNVTNAKL